MAWKAWSSPAAASAALYAARTLEPRHVVVPLREELGHTDLRLGTVLGADPETRRLRVHLAEGHKEELAFSAGFPRTASIAPLSFS
jgi:hypothetical protein